MKKKIFAYALRDYDEKDLFLAVCREAGVEYGYTSEYPTMENAQLAKGCSGISIITNPIGPELADRFYELGVRHISTRSIGTEHIDLAYCRKIDHPQRERLLSLPNVLLSPHVAFYTDQVVEEMIRNSVGALVND